MTDERDLVVLASAAIEDAARTLPPIPLPSIDASAAGFAPVSSLVVVSHEPIWPQPKLLDDGACRVYWGSHGCRHDRGHDGDHECDCCECQQHPDDAGCVAGPPYYGPDTRFYGEDAEALGLPLTDDD